ncbi:MAG: GDP-mannose 4,6-dehydratase [Gemmatimonadetes bacterium]|nr:GDP-mannose 4,6-dehydratase [Gemmatimonadota bacterium]
MRALVTGSHGFAGTPLCALLRERGFEVHGLASGPAGPEEDGSYHRADLRDPAAVRAAVDAADPEIVFHLAALTGRGGEEQARLTFDVNVHGTANLCAALLDRGKRVRLVHAGSSAQYGAVPREDDPVTEDAPQRPLGVYGWTKSASEAIALAHHGRGKIEVVAARAFNHTGPGEPVHLVCSGFARQIAEIEAGAEPVIRVGNLSPERDFTDVRDIARGYLDLAEKGTPGVPTNLCSGRATRIEDVLTLLLDRSEAKIEVRADTDRARPVELRRQVGSYARAERDLGWSPRIALADSLGELLKEWRRRTLAAKESRS